MIMKFTKEYLFFNPMELYKYDHSPKNATVYAFWFWSIRPKDEKTLYLIINKAIT